MRHNPHRIPPVKLSRCVLYAISLCAIVTAYGQKTADATSIKAQEITPVSTPVQLIPEPETVDTELDSFEAPHLISVGTCTITYYCPCVRCNGNPDQVARDGSRLIPYVTCAVDPEIIPLGSEVQIDFGGGDVQYFRACDTGSAIQKNHIDICVNTHEEALELGVKTAKVTYQMHTQQQKEIQNTESR